MRIALDASEGGGVYILYALLCHLPGCSGLIEVIGSLEIHPEFWRCPQSLSEVQCGLCRDTAFPADQFIESRLRPAYSPCELELAPALRFEKLLEQHLAGMERMFRLPVHSLHLYL